MTQIEITSITGLTYPYLVYVCNVYGNYCILVATIITNVGPSITITLPPQFENAPAVGIKIITCNGCEIFKVIYCGDDNNKQFMNLEDFYMMNGNFYQFQYQN
jgi:hypothetical protein